MDSIGVGELKADFSHVLDEVQKYGKKFVIEYGKKHKKVAMLVPYEEPKHREFGILKGKGGFSLGNDFEMTDEELLGL